MRINNTDYNLLCAIVSDPEINLLNREKIRKQAMGILIEGRGWTPSEKEFSIAQLREKRGFRTIRDFAEQKPESLFRNPTFFCNGTRPVGVIVHLPRKGDEDTVAKSFEAMGLDVEFAPHSCFTGQTITAIVTPKEAV